MFGMINHVMTLEKKTFYTQVQRMPMFALEWVDILLT